MTIIEGFVIISGTFLSSTLGPSIVEIVKDKLRKTTKDPLKDAIEFNQVIYNKLFDIQAHMKSDRVWLSQFHNGGHFYPTGKSIQKFSMMYEIVSLNTLSQQHNFQNIPVSLLSKSINELAKNKVIIIPDFDDKAVEDFGLKAISESSKIKSLYIFPVSSIEGKFIGMCGVEFTHKRHLNQQDMLYLHSNVSAIGSILMNHLNAK